MKALSLTFLIASALSAQVTVTIADQGGEVIKQVTGQSPKTAVLLSAIVCNESPDQDATISTGRIYRAIELDAKQPAALYSSEVVDAVLAEMQSRDIFARLYKAGSAGATIGAILLTAFKSSPLASTILQVAPPIYAATIGVVHSPRDLTEFGKKILSDNGNIVLPKSACSTSLVVARTSAAVASEKVAVQ